MLSDLREARLRALWLVLLLYVTTLEVLEADGGDSEGLRE
jgi:hypothetical protein